jgi:hypothetical protein
MTPDEPRATHQIRWRVAIALVVWSLVAGVGPVHGQGMDLRQASGVPLPAADLPAGSVSVRVVRGSFANNVAGQSVVFTVDGAARTETTDASGRVQVSGLRAGAKVTAATVVDGERLVSQEVTIGSSGVRFVLVAAGPADTASGPGPASAAAAAPGSVTIGPDSRIVIDFSNERLNVYYVASIVNPAATPVDLGGPLVFELPSAARSATVMEGSTPNAKASGAHVTVTGPFAPGKTEVNIVFELPFSGDTALLDQAWPADAASFNIFGLKTGALDLASPQITQKQTTVQQGQPVIMAFTPALRKGETLSVSVTGLPSHALWPRNVAFGLAGVITAFGVWAAFGPSSRRRRA